MIFLRSALTDSPGGPGRPKDDHGAPADRFATEAEPAPDPGAAGARPQSRPAFPRGAAAKNAQAAPDAAIRADRPGQAVQSEDQRDAAQSRLCLRDARARRAEAGVRRSIYLASAPRGRDPHRA